jgi:hypothetical protein
MSSLSDKDHNRSFNPFRDVLDPNKLGSELENSSFFTDDLIGPENANHSS